MQFVVFIEGSAVGGENVVKLALLGTERHEIFKTFAKSVGVALGFYVVFRSVEEFIKGGFLGCGQVGGVKGLCLCDGGIESRAVGKPFGFWQSLNRQA